MTGIAVRDYDVHGIGLRVSSGRGALLAAIDDRLRHFATPARESVDLHVEFCERDDPALVAAVADARSGRVVYDPPTGDVRYLPDADRVVVRLGDRVHALVEPGAGRARIGSRAVDADDDWFATHPILTIALLELFRRRGLYALHAAALARNGRGLLLSGRSGAGKSTLTVALLRAGFDFLGDDTCFASQDESGVIVRGFPDEVDLTDATLDMFTELHGLRAHATHGIAAKRQLLPEQVYTTVVPAVVRAEALVMPEVAGTAVSRLVPLEPAEAFMTLLPNVLLTDSGAAQRHLATLSALVSQVRCYRLYTGRDLDAVPALLDDVLRQSA